MSPDRETLQDACLAIACLAQDPDGLLLHISPLRRRTLPRWKTASPCRNFAEEIAVLRALTTWREDTMQEEVRGWVQSGQRRPAQAIWELILAPVVPPDGVRGNDNSCRRETGASCRRGMLGQPGSECSGSVSAPTAPQYADPVETSWVFVPVGEA